MTTLQREANRLCGYTAQQTLDYTQSLYEQKLVTYPRTDSQYITEDMEQTALSMVKTVCACFNQFAGYVNEPNIKRCINNSKVSDHHAIIPTEQICNAHITALPSGERNILLLIAARLLLATSEPHLYESIKVTVECESHNFFASGKSVTQIGYKALEKVVKNSFRSTKGVSEDEESSFKLATVSRYNSVPAKISEHYTAPPKQFTEDTLLSAKMSGFRNGVIIPYVTSVTGIAFWLRISKLLTPVVKNWSFVRLIGDNTYSIMLHQRIKTRPIVQDSNTFL